MENVRLPKTDDAALREAWGSWVASMGDWHVFGALTYRQQRERGMPPADVARAHVRRWLREAPRKTGVRVEAAVIALEYQKNGWPHFHPLLRLQGGAAPGVFGRLGQLWYGQHGYARLEQPRNVTDVAEYAAKYLTKDLARGDVIFWPPSGPLDVHQAGLFPAGRRPGRGRR